MQLNQVLYLMGLRPRPRTYPFEVRTFHLPIDGPVEYAQWLHPKESPKAVGQDVVTHLRGFLRPGDVAIDIGAHTGDSTLPIALAVGSGGCVLALEPNPYVFRVLCRNAELNPGKVRIVPLMVAATPSDGPIEFEYSDAGFCNGGRHEGVSPWRHGHAFKLKVQGRNLESLLMSDYPDLLPRIRYIKVDAEGYDHSVLLSVRNILRATRPFLMAEVFKWTDRAQREAFVRFLQQEGYDVFHVRGDADYRGEPVGPEDVMRWPHYDVFCVPITRPPR